MRTKQTKSTTSKLNLSVLYIYISIISVLYQYYISIIPVLYQYYISIISVLYQYYTSIISVLYQYYTSIISVLYQYYISIIPVLYQYYTSIISVLYQKRPATIERLGLIYCIPSRTPILLNPHPRSTPLIPSSCPKSTPILPRIYVSFKNTKIYTKSYKMPIYIYSFGKMHILDNYALRCIILNFLPLGEPIPILPKRIRTIRSF